MTQLGDLGGRHSHSTGWEFGASSSFLPPTLLPGLEVSARPGTAVAFVPSSSCFLNMQGAETCSEIGLGLC